MTEPKAKIIHHSLVPAVPISPTTPGSSMRWLIDREHDGAAVFSLRLVEMEPGATSLKHSHAYEHENFILEGKGRVLIHDTWHSVQAGDVVYIPPNVLHTFENNGSGVFKMLCAATV